VNASGTYKTEAGQVEAAAVVRKIGAEHIIVGTDCGQTVNVYPTDCLVLTARALRAHGVTERELDLMYKVNPAKLLGLPPLEETVASPTARR
jgi:predicted metal-dependent TIM-barrel fold hydrolase